MGILASRSWRRRRRSHTCTHTHTHTHLGFQSGNVLLLCIATPLQTYNICLELSFLVPYLSNHLHLPLPLPSLLLKVLLSLLILKKEREGGRGAG